MPASSSPIGSHTEVGDTRTAAWPSGSSSPSVSPPTLPIVSSGCSVRATRSAAAACGSSAASCSGLRSISASSDPNGSQDVPRRSTCCMPKAPSSPDPGTLPPTRGASGPTTLAAASAALACGSSAASCSGLRSMSASSSPIGIQTEGGCTLRCWILRCTCASGRASPSVPDTMLSPLIVPVG